MSTEDDTPDDDIRDDELSALYRKTDIAAPPASLDQSILAAAKQAVDHKSSTHGFSRAPFSGGWPIAASVAAVVVIAVMLAPLLERETPPATTSPTGAMDDMRSATERAEAEKSAREPVPASGPGRLYAPMPARPVETPPRSERKKPFTDEDRSFASGRSGAAAPEFSSTTQSRQRRGQAGHDAASGAPLAIFTPEMWLVKIQQLIDSGKIREAGDELARFRLAYPDYELDQHLLEQLKLP